MTEVHAVVGSQGEGKTTAVTATLHRAGAAGWTVHGVVAPVVYAGDDRIGYDLIDLANGNRSSWLRVCGEDATIGPFTVRDDGEVLARRALGLLLETPCDLAVIDEVGEWELQGGGHAWAMDRLNASPAARILLVMRDTVVDRVSARWELSIRCWSPSDVSALAAALGIPDKEGLDATSM